MAGIVSRSAGTKDAWHRRVVVHALLVAMAEPAMRVASPGENAALGEQSAIHALPSDTVMLDDGLIRDTEGAASSEAPVCGIQAYRRLLKRFASAA